MRVFPSAAIAVLLVTILAVPSFSQGQDVSDIVKDKMAGLRWIEGTWTGEATFRKPGESDPAPIAMLEKAHFELDGMILIFEGLGKRDGEVVHHAYATVTWDVRLNKYVMQAMTKEGQLATPGFTVEGETMTWEMKMPEGTVKYVIRHQDGRWVETGSFSRDGESWNVFFEMDLKKES